MSRIYFLTVNIILGENVAKKDFFLSSKSFVFAFSNMREKTWDGKIFINQGFGSVVDPSPEKMRRKFSVLHKNVSASRKNKEKFVTEKTKIEIQMLVEVTLKIIKPSRRYHLLLFVLDDDDSWKTKYV